MPSKLHKSYILSFILLLNALHCAQYSVSISEELSFKVGLKKHIASPTPSCFNKITGQCYVIKFVIDKTTPILATDPMYILKNLRSIPIFAVFSN